MLDKVKKKPHPDIKKGSKYTVSLKARSVPLSLFPSPLIFSRRLHGRDWFNISVCERHCRRNFICSFFIGRNAQEFIPRALHSRNSGAWVHPGGVPSRWALAQPREPFKGGGEHPFPSARGAGGFGKEALGPWDKAGEASPRGTRGVWMEGVARGRWRTSHHIPPSNIPWISPRDFW